MLSLVLTVFFVNVAIYLVNTIGASTIDQLVRIPSQIQTAGIAHCRRHLS